MQGVPGETGGGVDGPQGGTAEKYQEYPDYHGPYSRK